jgi:hypothetical protein
VNRYYNACADLVQQAMDEFAELTGRQYRVFEYHGDPALSGCGADGLRAAKPPMKRWMPSTPRGKGRGAEGAPLSPLRQHRLHECPA